ncbi:MAG: hypothetical protein NT173_15945, partial [Opitutales bacterium]|nr:hypothetical protein [Opitutales bacterium]
MAKTRALREAKITLPWAAAGDEKQAAQRWGNVTDFVDWLKKRAEEDGANLVQLAQTVALLSQLDRRDDSQDAVSLSTVHAAKGLEFAHVFIVGCEEGMMPHLGGLEIDEPGTGEPGAPGVPESADALAQRVRVEEERRLMYVAVTRAKRSLTLTWCGSR